MASFSFSPDPLSPDLPCLRTSNNPPPPGRGTSRPVSVHGSRRRHNQPASRLHARSLTLFVRYCPIPRSDGPPALAHFCLLPVVPARFAHLRRPAPRPAARYGKREADSVPLAPLLPACFSRYGKGGAGIPSPVSPRPARFAFPAYLQLFLFPTYQVWLWGIPWRR